MLFAMMVFHLWLLFLAAPVTSVINKRKSAFVRFGKRPNNEEDDEKVIPVKSDYHFVIFCRATKVTAPALIQP